MYQDYRAAWTQLTAPGADFEVVTTKVRGVDIRTYANAPGSLRDLWLSVGFKVLEDGNKVRIFKSTGEQVDA